MDNIRYFDCNCVMGRRVTMHPDTFFKTDELVNKMKSYGIEKAMVYHSIAREYDPMTGNRVLLEEIKNYPELMGVWVVLPHDDGGFPEPSELKGMMKENNIRAVRMFPGESSYSFSNWCCGDMFSMLEECRIPLMIDQRQVSWDQLQGVLSSHTELIVIITDVHCGSSRNVYPLMKQYKHLHLETLGYKDVNGIEDMCSRFGAQRLIFGSGAPFYSGGSAVGMLSYARISNEEKTMIAGGNLEKLLGGVIL